MRIKSTWFRAGNEKAPAEQAGAMAFIVFRVGHQMLKRMRSAGFDIDVGPPYFAFLAEALVFLVAVVDRIAFARMAGEDRAAFTPALVHHVARHLAENQTEYLGPEPSGTDPYADRFIDRVNEVVAHYADFGADPAASSEAGFTPDFAFVRYLGARLEPVLPEKDRRWVLDQVMATEAPDAVETLQRAMAQLLAPAPRSPRRRASLSGEKPRDPC
jgi:hypothetical protein